MKIALPTLNGKTITGHFGRTKAFVVVDVEDGVEVQRELREVGSCNQGEHPDPGHRRRHHDLVDTVQDCHVVIAGGMGLPVQERLLAAGIDVVLTDTRSMDEAVQQFAAGTLTHDPSRAHAPGGDHH
ncbi:MAG: NifB/NifX family molybdenum-iron cluster-binding protein [Actinomycetota bacterium]|nr:NifB/NifX family molybdenum-iron cluster-binding protein [Actinomycetota bacterium]